MDIKFIEHLPDHFHKLNEDGQRIDDSKERKCPGCSRLAFIFGSQFIGEVVDSHTWKINKVMWQRIEKLKKKGLQIPHASEKGY